jgi:uncharacterized surface protein with fasciclin (FAS1) repeats
VPPTQTDWELIQRDPQLSDYTSAVATDPQLVELINGDNVITVFAPTNAAIAQVPNWDAIVADPAALDSFVRSHAVAGALTFDQLFAGTTPTELTTLNGEKLIVDPVQRTINGAHIVTPDTPATNGVVQTIDRLLIVPVPTPTTTTAAAAPTTVAAAPTTVAAAPTTAPAG